MNIWMIYLPHLSGHWRHHFSQLLCRLFHLCCRYIWSCKSRRTGTRTLHRANQSRPWSISGSHIRGTTIGIDGRIWQRIEPFGMLSNAFSTKCISGISGPLRRSCNRNTWQCARMSWAKRRMCYGRLQINTKTTKLDDDQFVGPRNICGIMTIDLIHIPSQIELL